MNESHTPKGTTTKDLEQIVGQIAETNTKTFNKDEVTSEGTGHVKSLHNVVESKFKIISRVLIENGSALKCLPHHDSQSEWC